MRRVLSFDVASCTGCLSCMLNCALANESINALSSARIYIDLDSFEARWPARTCRQCVKAQCAAACPVGAISRDASGEFWRVDYDVCIGCRSCVDACPFGAMSFDPLTDKVLKCETCAGNPTCVRSCAAGALQWRDATQRTPPQKLMESS